MTKESQEKKKPYRSVGSNALWSFRGMLRDAPLAFWLTVLGVPVGVFLAWAEIRLPALVVAQVTEGRSFAQAAWAVGLLLGLMGLAAALQKALGTVSFGCFSQYCIQKEVELNRKSMSCFYQIYEKKQVRDLHSRALMAAQMWNGKQPISDMPRESVGLLQNLLCYALFGGMLSFVSPWLVVLLTATPAVNWFCARACQKYEYATREARTDVERRMQYVSERGADFAAAKDIRIYGMAGWIREIYHDLSRQSVGWSRRLNLRQFLSRLADLGIALVRDGGAYDLLLSMALRGELTVDQFVLYFGAISSFAAYVGNIMNAWNEMRAASLRVCDFREYIDLPDLDSPAQGARLPKTAPEITFDRVSFRYENGEEDTLRELSFTIQPGERVALVGANSAGKTTLIKLLCGLCRPSAGTVRVNGVPAEEFSRADYYRLFSPVFQDVRTAFFSLCETVSGRIGEQADTARAEDCMRRAGLGKKLAFVGGVILTVAASARYDRSRALYKDAAFIVLDEPTAALDPESEYEVYSKFNQISGGKTAIYISHRLASCKSSSSMRGRLSSRTLTTS